MALTLMWNGLDNPNASKKEIQEQAILKKYLCNAVGLAYDEDDGKIKAQTAAYSDKIGKETVDKASAQVRREMKEYGLKTKLNDRLGADRIEEAMKPYGKTKRFIAEAFAIAAPAYCTGFAVSMFNDTAGKAVGGALALNGLLKVAVRHAVLSSTEKEAMDVKKYGELKRIDWALKKLKKEMTSAEKAQKTSAYKNDVGKLFAAGYGQPSGGSVQAPVMAAKLKNQGR